MWVRIPPGLWAGGITEEFLRGDFAFVLPAQFNGGIMKESAGGGIGLLGLMFLIFMTLKLCHVISWSWWYVTMPLWGLPAIFVAILALMVVVFVIGFFVYLLALLCGYKP